MKVTALTDPYAAATAAALGTSIFRLRIKNAARGTSTDIIIAAPRVKITWEVSPLWFNSTPPLNPMDNNR